MQIKDAFTNLRWAVIIGTSYLIISENNYAINISGGFFLIFFILSNLIISSLQKRYASSSYFYAAVALTDILIVTSAIFIFGKPTSDFYVVYFFIIMLSALGENLKLGVLVATTASMIYAIYQLKTGDAGLELPVRVVFLFIVAIFNTSLVENLKKERMKVYYLEKEKEKLHSAIEEEKGKFGEMLDAIDIVMQIVNKEKQTIWTSRKNETGDLCYNLREGICTNCRMDNILEDRVFINEKVLKGKKKYLAVICSHMNNNNYICITQDMTKLRELREIEFELGIKKLSLSFLHRLPEALNRVKTIEELFSEIAATFEEMFGFEVMTLRALKDNYLDLIASRGIKKSKIPKIKSVSTKESISGSAVIMKKIVVIKDMDTFNASYALHAKMLNLKCLISLPIYSRGKLFGTLSAGSHSKKNIDDLHVNILNSSANILGISAVLFTAPPMN